jgi:flavin-binding protein dodecin
MKVVRTAIHSTITSLAARSHIRAALFAFRSNSEMRNQVAMMVEVAKIDEVIGFSEKSWEDAAQEAVTEAKKSNDSLYTAVSKAGKRAHVVRVIKRLDIQNMTAEIDPNTGIITQYQVCMKLIYDIKH